jgi:hypothetical protein
MDAPAPPPSDSPVLPPRLVLIGWKEYVEFPEWGLRRVRAKIDTGARTSALGVQSCRVEQGSGGAVLLLELALHRKKPGRVLGVRVPVVATVVVKNSGGQTEHRPVIETLLRLGPVNKRIRLTVTDRSTMRYPVLLGRLALAGSFAVDVTQKYLLKKTGPGA